MPTTYAIFPENISSMAVRPNRHRLATLSDHLILTKMNRLDRKICKRCSPRCNSCVCYSWWITGDLQVNLIVSVHILVVKKVSFVVSPFLQKGAYIY